MKRWEPSGETAFHGCHCALAPNVDAGVTVLDAVAVRREALAAGRTARGRIRAERLLADVVADLDRRRPARLVRAVARGRALDEEPLVHAQERRVPVEERHIDRPVGADDRVRALILIARVR